MPLSNLQQRHYDQACAQVDENSTVEILRMLIDTPSPTGEEAPLAAEIAKHLTGYGLRGAVQPLDDRQANALGSIQGSTRQDALLLYSPIDTVTSNDPREDLPWAGAEFAADMQANSIVTGDSVIGLGAQNPKGHAACIIAAARALKSAEIPLLHDLLLGFGAGGMPSNARPGTRIDSGHGVGCARLLEEAFKPSRAIIAKSGWSVSWEEVGFVWYEVTVKGTHTYVGSRHLMPYVNPINAAGKVIAALEDWFPEWTECHRSGLVAPQGVVSFIESGWERMPAFVPAVCRFRVDLRLSPRTSPEDADAAFGDRVRAIADQLAVDLSWRRLIAIPGTTTTPTHEVIQKSIQAWEAVEGRAHQPVAGLSGATDANILRAHGIPTARIGLPKSQSVALAFREGMNTAPIAAMKKLVQALIHASIAMCTAPE
ncbi:MAG: M20/M25/M40 family metallo-hydrolase [Pseudomonadota bacterium]|nr:M20/M25/M40 family metallo-hydrolase [Pseudomonadota bacterium]